VTSKQSTVNILGRLGPTAGRMMKGLGTSRCIRCVQEPVDKGTP
jgi:hypothetical protein